MSDLRANARARKQDHSAPKPKSGEISTRMGRFFAYLYVLFKDHGVLRLAWRNFHPIGENLYRANQPLPRDLAYYKKKYGIETVINLRGENQKKYFLLEKDACEALGIELVSIAFRSQQFPAKETLSALLDALAHINKPTLIHCKSGADRTGFAAVAYLVMQKNLPFSEAYEQQIGTHFLRFKAADAGIIDFIFDRWQEASQKSPLSLREWCEQNYDQDEMIAAFDAQKNQSRKDSGGTPRL